MTSCISLGGRGRSISALSAVLARAAADTVPITTIPGTVERARQHSRAAEIKVAAAIATGLPRSVIADAATVHPADRCATNQALVAVSVRDTQPRLWIPRASPSIAVSRPASRRAAPTYRRCDHT